MDSWNDDERALDNIQYTFEVNNEPDITVPVMCKQIGEALATIPRDICYTSASSYPQRAPNVQIIQDYTPEPPSTPTAVTEEVEELNSELLEVVKFATT